jgi:hypothetical protein
VGDLPGESQLQLFLGRNGSLGSATAASWQAANRTVRGLSQAMRRLGIVIIA